MSLFFFLWTTAMQVPATGILVLMWCWKGPSPWPCSETYPTGNQQDRDLKNIWGHKEVFVFFCPHSLSCSSLFMGELGSEWGHFSSAGHEIHGFDNILQKRQESVYKKLKLPCIMDHRQESCLCEGKNTLFPDMWESTWVVRVLNCYRRCCLLHV